MIAGKKAGWQLDPSEDLRSGERTLRLDCSHQSDTLLITFAVFPAADGKARFDFVKSTSALNAKRVYVRDEHQLWYQKGTPLLGDSVPEVVASLKKIIEAQNVRRVIAIGNSGGGFAAILLGVMLGVDEIHTFNAQTRLVMPDDTSYPERLLMLQNEFGPGKPFMDLRTVLETHPGAATRITIHYSRGDKTDRRHARYLASFPNVRIIDYPVVDHHLAHFCSTRGLLAPLFAAVVDGDEARFDQVVHAIRKAGNLSYVPERAAWVVERSWDRMHRYVHKILVALMGSGSLWDF